MSGKNFPMCLLDLNGWCFCVNFSGGSNQYSTVVTRKSNNYQVISVPHPIFTYHTLDISSLIQTFTFCERRLLVVIQTNAEFLNPKNLMTPPLTPNITPCMNIIHSPSPCIWLTRILLHTNIWWPNNSKQFTL